jgi:hypothetical protein
LRLGGSRQKRGCSPFSYGGSPQPSMEPLPVDVKVHSRTVEAGLSDFEAQSGSAEADPSDLEAQSGSIEADPSDLEGQSGSVEADPSDLGAQSGSMEAGHSDLEAQSGSVGALIVHMYAVQKGKNRDTVMLKAVFSSTVLNYSFLYFTLI